MHIFRRKRRFFYQQEIYPDVGIKDTNKKAKTSGYKTGIYYLTALPVNSI